MAGATFIPVELGIIERGNFEKEVKEAFAKLQRDFVAFVDEHEVSAKASLSVGIELNFKKTSTAGKSFEGNYGIITKIVPTLPKKPSGVTTAFVGENKDGHRTLFTQSTGTSKGNPKQLVMADGDGAAVE